MGDGALRVERFDEDAHVSDRQTVDRREPPLFFVSELDLPRWPAGARKRGDNALHACAGATDGDGDRAGLMGRWGRATADEHTDNRKQPRQWRAGPTGAPNVPEMNEIGTIALLLTGGERHCWHDGLRTELMNESWAAALRTAHPPRPCAQGRRGRFTDSIAALGHRHSGSRGGETRAVLGGGSRRYAGDNNVTPGLLLDELTERAIAEAEDVTTAHPEEFLELVAFE